MILLLRLSVILLLFGLAATRTHAQEKGNELCGPIIVEYEFDLKWTTSEKRLLCGGKGVPSWQNIPLRQAEYFLRSFLQSRGYHNPQFERVNDKLYVRPGAPTLITRLRTDPEFPGLAIDDYWLPKGKPLTPGELNGIEKWVTMKLGRLGYACPLVHATGDNGTGEVLVRIDPKLHWTIDNVVSEPIPYVRGGMLTRYWAFDLGDSYDPILLELTAKRMEEAQVVVNTSLSPDCRSPTIGNIRQTTLPGQPRLVSFGFGFDSENYFIARGSWRNSRLSETASLLDVSGKASYRQQSVITNFNWYYLPIPTRHYLKNYLRFERNFEKTFESRSIKGLTAPAWQRDIAGLNLDAYIGPSLAFESTIRGEAPDNARLLTIDMGISGQSNLYEYYIADPVRGYQFNLFGSFSNKSAVSDLTLSHYMASFTSLWSLLDLEPEIWILGLRGIFATTKPGPGLTAEDVPPSFKQFLGGSDDMRGFERKSLPRGDVGSLTKAYVGTEMRLNNILPYKLQPLIFVDWGWLGDEPFEFEARTFTSVGVGMRWQSPIGTVRVSVAQGLVEGKDAETYPEEIQPYFSLGEQF